MGIYNGQTLTYYLHFYDEGLLYNGFWVVNDLETGYVETEGRVFIYNSENDYCPESTYNYWYFWRTETGFTTLAFTCKPADHHHHHHRHHFQQLSFERYIGTHI